MLFINFITLYFIIKFIDSYEYSREEIKIMSTYMAKPADIVRKWFVIDATGKSLGRLAAVTANILRGKNKPIFTPHVDCGDHVIIINADKVKLTGKKLEKKYYRYHTGWVGGLKEIQYKTLMSKNPEKAIMLAVKGMIPDTTIGRKALTRVRIYKGENHNHQAQQPEVLTI